MYLSKKTSCMNLEKNKAQMYLVLSHKCWAWKGWREVKEERGRGILGEVERCGPGASEVLQSQSLSLGA